MCFPPPENRSSFLPIAVCVYASIGIPHIPERYPETAVTLPAHQFPEISADA